MSNENEKNNTSKNDQNNEDQAELSIEKINELEGIKREKLKNLREKGKDPFKIENFRFTHYSKNVIDNFESLEDKEVKVSGRIMANRHMGKASFIDIHDRDGKIQIYVKKDNIGDSEYEEFIKFDIGDIVGVEGKVFKTKHGEVSINASKIILLSKSLRVLPNKWQGLKDIELKYRKRYVDLIMSKDTRELFRKRTKIIQGIKSFLAKRDYLEVDTPILTTIAGGANARPFNTHHNSLNLDMKLRISNELFLKRLIVGGMDRVYEMGKMFRNEGIDKNHNPEYTSIELYQAFADMDDMAEITENCVAEVCMEVNGTTKINYQGTELDLKAPWKRIYMHDAVNEKIGVNFLDIDEAKAREIGKEHHIEDAEKLSWGVILSELFEKYCEEDLIQPCFVIGHPVEISPLAKKDPSNPRITRRFEAFINGWEIANAFSELNDPIDQYERFKEQQAMLTAGDDEAHPMDTDFVEALEVGLPPTGGLGIGVDRVIMLLTNAVTIRDIIFFPTMK